MSPWQIKPRSKEDYEGLTSDELIALHKRQNEYKLSAAHLALLREAHLKRVTAHPLYEQYRGHINRPHAKNSEPWHAIGERVYASAMCAFASTDLNIGVYGLKGDEAASWREQMLLEYSQRIWRSTPYLWSDEIEKLADAAPLPKYVISRGLTPTPAMF